MNGNDGPVPRDPQTFEAYLAAYGTLTYAFRGTSMLPLLRGNGSDLVRIRRRTEGERCRRYDVVLYRRADRPGHYILHRVVRVLPDGYDCRGDHCTRTEYGIREDEVIGILEAYTRADRIRSADSLRYRLYGRIRVRTFPLRRLFSGLRGTLRRFGRAAGEDGGRTEEES